MTGWVCVAGEHAWQGGMHGRGCVWQGGMAGGACVVGGMCCGGEGMYGRGTCMVGWHALQGACMAGGMHGRGHAWWGACIVGGMHGKGGVHGGGMHGRRDGHCSRRYTSYWNAFLLYGIKSPPRDESLRFYLNFMYFLFSDDLFFKF